jgi:hypothetical protein
MCVQIAQVRTVKKHKAKITGCSRMGKFCPHAAALRKLGLGDKYVNHICAIVDEWGVGGNWQNWQGSAPPPSPKIDFSCFPALF